jgi:hypothetical protein
VDLPEAPGQVQLEELAAIILAAQEVVQAATLSVMEQTAQTAAAAAAAAMAATPVATAATALTWTSLMAPVVAGAVLEHSLEGRQGAAVCMAPAARAAEEIQTPSAGVGRV